MNIDADIFDYDRGRQIWASRCEMVCHNAAEGMAQNWNRPDKGEMVEQGDNVTDVGRHVVLGPMIGFTKSALIECDQTPSGGQNRRKRIEIRRAHPVPMKGDQGASTSSCIQEGENYAVVFKTVSVHELSFRFCLPRKGN